MTSTPGTGEPWMVVGLGNPGPSYAGNRHNVGFMVADLMAGRAPTTFRSHRGRADVATILVDGVRVILVKPRSFMNLSGGPSVAVRDYFHVPLEHVVVVHDELDIPFGTLRLKRGGGDNGHNGLRSITQSFGSPDYLRVRVGIGRPPGRMDPAAFVLRDFAAAERSEVDLLVDRAADAAESVVVDGLEASQNVFNR